MAAVAFFGAALSFPAAALAQSYGVLHAFTSDGASPQSSLIQATDGNFYGTTAYGGTNNEGAIFKMDPAGNVTMLFDFTGGSDGGVPVAGLIQATDGNFYGTTRNGGASGDNGTVFRIDSSGNLTTLHSFGFSDGAAPFAQLIQASDGNFYGTTFGGGANGYGTVFRIDSAGNLTTLYNFASSDGSNPRTGLIQATDGSFYGTTSGGGSNGYGTVFKIDLSGNLSTLHSFAGSPSDGATPNAGLIQANDGNFYGTTYAGGAGVGTVFQMDSSGNLTTLHNFIVSDGANPYAGLVQATDGNLYGATAYGGVYGSGTVFRIDSTGDLATLHSFAGLGDGTTPEAAIIQAIDGNFYSTTFGGGVSIFGTVFKMDLSGNLTILHSFGFQSGANPSGGLLQATDGNFYGTTAYGGAFDYGTVFKMDSAGNLTTLHIFTGSDGYDPAAGLIQATDGNFYGTTVAGGFPGAGTVFKVDAAGNLTTLHSFGGSPGDGVNPYAGLIQATDGNFYGMTYGGGTQGYGTVFRMDSSGNLVVLHSFTGSDGANPFGGLIQATDGNFYGTTTSGGASGYGTVFKIDSSGNLTTLHNFAGPPNDGAYPQADLLQATDGDFYGTSGGGGTGGCIGGCGTVFRMDSTGNLTVLHSFTGSDGKYPVSPLIQVSDGNFYGTAIQGGTANNGTVFKTDSAGNLTTLHLFTGPPNDGFDIFAGLVQAADGNLYGTTFGGGPSSGGVVYRLATCSPAPTPVITVTECLAANTPGFIALVPGNAGDTYYWTLTGGGSIDSGQGTNMISFTSGASGTLMSLSILETNSSNCAGEALQNLQVDYTDEPPSDPFYSFVCTLGRDRVTAGCGGGNYCPTASVTRAQMAVFLLEAEHGVGYLPPPCAGIFQDVACPGGFAVDWIEELYNEGITAGCSANPRLFCPNDPVTRAQMAVFLLKARYGPTYQPHACSGIFQDVSCPAGFAVDWIEELYHEGITAGCSASPPLFCPDDPNTRGQMAVFLVETFNLQ